MGMQTDNCKWKNYLVQKSMDNNVFFCPLVPYYNSTSRVETYKRITFLMEVMSNEAKNTVKTIFNSSILEEIQLRDANELLIRSSPRDASANIGGSNNNNGSNK